MKQTLPERPNLEHLKTQARELLQSIQAGHPDALTRVREATGSDQPATLATAQWVIAKEYGEESWPRLKQRVEEIRASESELVEKFLRNAYQGWSRPAEEMLERHPWLSSATAATACATGNLAVMQATITDPNAPIGPDDRPPLFCVGYSIFSRLPESKDRMTEAVRWLLDQGADPNLPYNDPAYPGNPFSALYFALGYHNNLEMGELLLDRGASPNDNESLFHSTEHKDLKAMRLLLSRGADPNDPPAMIPMLDAGRLEGVRLLLAHGCDPNAGKEPTLVHAAKTDAPDEVIAALLNAGGDPNRPDEFGVDAVDWAWRLNRQNHLQLYRTAGAKENLTPVGIFLKAIYTGNHASAPPDLIDQALKGKRALGFELAHYGKAEPLTRLLDAGYPIDHRSSWENSTMLMEACFHGQIEVVRLLVERGADLTLRDESFDGTALGWTLFASEFRPHPEHARILRVLLEAGAPRSLNDAEGSPECQAVLAQFS